MNSERGSNDGQLNVEAQIFRPGALQSFTERHAKAVLPRSPVPAWFVFTLWVFLVLASAGGVAAWLAASAAIHSAG